MRRLIQKDGLKPKRVLRKKRGLRNQKGLPERAKAGEMDEMAV